MQEQLQRKGLEIIMAVFIKSSSLERKNRCRSHPRSQNLYQRRKGRRKSGLCRNREMQSIQVERLRKALP